MPCRKHRECSECSNENNSDVYRILKKVNSDLNDDSLLDKIKSVVPELPMRSDVVYPIIENIINEEAKRQVSLPVERCTCLLKKASISEINGLCGCGHILSLHYIGRCFAVLSPIHLSTSGTVAKPSISERINSKYASKVIISKNNTMTIASQYLGDVIKDSIQETNEEWIRELSSAFGIEMSNPSSDINNAAQMIAQAIGIHIKNEERIAAIRMKIIEELEA